METFARDPVLHRNIDPAIEQIEKAIPDEDEAVAAVRDFPISERTALYRWAERIADARSAGCDLICLSTDLGGYAERLYARLGFERAFESALYTRTEAVYVPPKRRARTSAKR